MADDQHDRLHLAMGSSLANWARVEGALAKLLAQILGCRLEQAGIIWYSFSGFSSKIDMINSLVAEGFDNHPIQSHWKELADYTVLLAGRRNQIAHRETVVSTTGIFPLGESVRRDDKAALAPHGWDLTLKGKRQLQKATFFDADEVEFASREFFYLGSLIMDAYLALAGYSPSPDTLERPIVRLQRTDSPLGPQRRKHPQQP